jgi:hypothetical protein
MDIIVLDYQHEKVFCWQREQLSISKINPKTEVVVAAESRRRRLQQLLADLDILEEK